MAQALPMLMMGAMSMMNKPKTPPAPPAPPPPIPLPDPGSRRAQAESEDTLRRKIQGRGRSGTILTNEDDPGAGTGGNRLAGSPAPTFQNKTLGA